MFKRALKDLHDVQGGALKTFKRPHGTYMVSKGAFNDA